MSLEEDIRKKFGKMQDISISRLHPPMDPKPIVSEKEECVGSIPQASSVSDGSPHEISSSKPAIDFNNMPKTYWIWCDRLETKRTWYHARFDKVHRGSVESLKRDVQERDQELDIVQILKKKQAPIFMDVMNEYKTKVAKLRGRKDEN